MSVRVAINGFGRIGRALCRAWFERRLSTYAGVELVAINDCEASDHLAYLLQHDSVYRRFLPQCHWRDGQLRIGSLDIPMTCYAELPDQHWQSLGVDWVVEATGCHTARSMMMRHLDGGAKRVLLTAPSQEVDATLIAGVNHQQFNPDQHRLVSAASCTTQALAAVCQPILAHTEILAVMMTEVHAATLDQPILDTVHANAVRGRAGAYNMVPTSTTGDKVIGQVLPALQGKVQGYSMRVPVPNGACLDLTFQLAESLSIADIRQMFQASLNGSETGSAAIVQWVEQPWVSSDVTGLPYSAVIDLNHLRVNGHLLQLLAWYDNEWGYVSRLLDFLQAQRQPVAELSSERVTGNDHHE